MPTTILLIAPESVALPVADALRQDLHVEVELTPSRRAGLASLRHNDFSLVLIDEGIATSDIASADLIYQNAGCALVVELNFAISSAARIVRQARAALARSAQDHAQALAAATATLHSELNSTLAGILLESELALREAAPAQAHRLRHLVKLAGELRDRLRA